MLLAMGTKSMTVETAEGTARLREKKTGGSEFFTSWLDFLSPDDAVFRLPLLSFRVTVLDIFTIDAFIKAAKLKSIAAM